jgi:mono/diheme cytochrome c family protein
MPSFDWKLSDDDIAALLTYVRNAWGNTAGGVQPDDVAKMRTALHREAQRSP